MNVTIWDSTMALMIDTTKVYSVHCPFEMDRMCLINIDNSWIYLSWICVVMSAQGKWSLGKYEEINMGQRVVFH